MDEDSKIIEELRNSNDYLRAQVSHLEKSLKQAIASQEEMKMVNNNEIHKSKEVIDDLNRKLDSCMSTINAKNVELLNLQTALGQYYAEIEAKVYSHDIVCCVYSQINLFLTFLSCQNIFASLFFLK